MANKKWFTWVLEIKIERDFVAEGYNISEDRAKMMVKDSFPFMRIPEFKTKIIKKPLKKELKEIQVLVKPKKRGKSNGKI